MADRDLARVVIRRLLDAIAMAQNVLNVRLNEHEKNIEQTKRSENRQKLVRETTTGEKRNMPTKLRFVSLDGEMTGSGSRDRKRIAFKEFQLIQIGLATMEMGVRPDARVFKPETLKTFVSDIGYDEWNSQPQAMEVNKFTSERIKAGPVQEIVDRDVNAWLDERVGAGKRDLHAVGWNVGSFDMPFVREYLPMLGDRFSYRSVDLNSILYSMADTDDEYKALKGKAKSGAEVELRKMGIEANFHDAGYDAANALIAFKLLREQIMLEEVG